ncbi:hypothetical protein KP509_28G055500 [Ceratopteris richardii]|uniref:EngC GTPase domain-containing protein n=1 Tax=Ceratopteris richardii TaxID=49495 RepID=A0A8T2RDZ8_CERRI|nr:hypothetical protein KP509_28G055500 [Ceratopteris richardii]
MDKLSTQRQAFHGCLSSMYDVRIRAWGFQRDFLLLEQRADHRNDLRICAGRHVGNARKENPQKQKPRDFGKSNVPLNVKTSAPQQEPSSRRAEDYLELQTDQAIGRIVSSQANFMRVVVINSGTTAMENEAAVDTGCDTCSNDMNASAIEVPFATAESLGAKEKLGRELLCVVRALLKKIKRRVMVGDKVLVSGIDWVDGRGMIEEVFDRETEVLDPPVANVDQLIVLAALDRPRPEPFSLSRFLVEAESTRIPFTVVFNKVDLVSSEDVSDWESRLTSWGYKPLFCSATLKLGTDSLVELLANKTSAIIGLSGVGKSSMINALCDETGAKLWNSNSKVEPDVVEETAVLNACIKFVSCSLEFTEFLQRWELCCHLLPVPKDEHNAHAGGELG